MRPLKHTGSQFMGGGLPAPVPTLGAEAITNGNMSSATGWTLGGAWAIAGGIATCTAGIGSAIRQLVLTPGTWYLAQYDVLTATAGTFQLTIGTSSSNQTVPGTHYQAANAATNFIGVNTASAAAGTIDNMSCKPITLASMFSARPYGTHNTTKAMATVVTGTRAGVVANLDSATAPANFVVASHDGVNCRLTKCVAGTYTSLITTTVTYVAGAYVEIRRLATTNTFQLFYNGSQVGANQTIADAGIISNTLAGYFQTYSGNTLAGFSCVPSA
jgi:hypothetical protein